MRVSVIGTGYVGLVSGVCLTEKGHQVICVDIDKEKVAKINQGVPPIYEKGLGDLLEKNIGKKLTATTNLSNAIQQTEISLIAVGTPFDGEEIDLRFIKSVSQQIGEVLSHKDDYHVVVVKSTVVPGTTDDVVVPILEEASGKRSGVDFGVGMNPEFLREGEAVDDFMNPDRIVLGAFDNKTLEVLEELYAPFTDIDIVPANTKTAEMIKYTSNSLLATMISFSNEIANLCAVLGNIDVADSFVNIPTDSVVEIFINTNFIDNFNFSDQYGTTIDPATIEVNFGTFTLLPTCGYTAGTFDIASLVALVSYMFESGPQLLISDADCNCDCNIDVSDLVCFVDYMFGGGPNPGCGK